jgi:GxxExxY protein
MQSEIENMNENQLSEIIVNACYEVHSNLGPGLLESTYEQCLFHELKVLGGLDVISQAPVSINYKGETIDSALRLDLWIEKKVILEIKAVKELNDIHMAQILTYLKLTDNRLGFLINFNVTRINMVSSVLQIE